MLTIDEVIARFRIGAADSEFEPLMNTCQLLGYPIGQVDVGVWEITIGPDLAYHVALVNGRWRLVRYP